MTVANYGEDRLVAALLAELPAPDARRVLTPPGDDCAVVRLPAGKRGRRQLLKTDCVIEGIHFTADMPPEQIGWKALCRPLSDIAAMGGTPAFALITLALAAETPLDWARCLYIGLGRAAREFGVEIVGGETARSPGPCFLSVCLTGEPPRKPRRALRAGGRPGDWLYVTGRLGGSFASGRHLTFRPRLEEGRWLAEHFSVRAMMDLSDGLGADLPRLAHASGAGFALDPARLPCAPGCSPAQAMNDGEDYELLFAIGPRRAAKLEHAWRRRFPNLELTNIGKLTSADSRDSVTQPAGGFDHFKTEPLRAD